MAKLQRIKRANGSLVFSVNIPLELIEELKWKKGLELQILTEFGKLIIFTEDKIDEKEVGDETSD